MDAKIIVITMGLNDIVKNLVEKTNVVGIIECAPRKQKNRMLNKFIRETFAFSLKVKEKFSKNIFTLQKFSKKKGIPYFYMTKNSSDLENWIQSKNPDLIIIYSMSMLLKKNIFEIPKYGTINLHPSLLPKYRGPNPIFWQYYFFEKKGGITLHYIDEGEDTGDIIYQKSFDIYLGMGVEKFRRNVVEYGSKLILKAIENFDSLPRLKQPKESPTPRARNINSYEIWDLISWNNWTIKRVFHLFKGIEGWLDIPYGNFYVLKPLIYERVPRSNLKTPGRLYKLDRDKFEVFAKDGRIILSKEFDFKRIIIKG